MDTVMTNKHPDALDDGTFSKSTTKRLNLCTSGEPANKSADSMQMDALVDRAMRAQWSARTLHDPWESMTPRQQDAWLATMRAAMNAIDLPKLLADAGRWHHFALSPQTALMLGSTHDPEDSTFLWRQECDRLADAAMQAEGK